jgi:predicted phage tail protein
LLELTQTLHIFAAFATLASISAVVIHVRNGGSKADNPSRALMGAAHGVGLLLSLLSGFAMLGFMKIGFPGWAMAKMGVWLVLGGVTAVLYRKPKTATSLWLGTIILASLAAFLAISKPF